MAAEPLDRPIFIGGTGSDGAAALALVLSAHPDLLACTPVRFGVISDPNGVIDAMQLGQAMLRANRVPWWERLLAEKQPAFHAEPMMGEERTPPEELVELVHRLFLPGPLLKPIGHRAEQLTPALIEAASERYLATFWDDPAAASIRLIHDLLRPTHGSGLRWIDASRLGAVRAAALAELFPEARFVHIVRDGRDVALRFMEIATGSAFPGAPESTIPIDPAKEWNPKAFERGLALWERRLISAASGLQRVPAGVARTVRLAELLEPGAEAVLESLQRFLGVEPAPEVASALSRHLNRDALQQGRWERVVPAPHRTALATAYQDALARLDDLGIPLP